MPERPKRRKNNKNKRKNKNQRIEGHKNVSDVKLTEDAESCSGEQTSLTEDVNLTTQTSENNITSFPSTSDQDNEAVIEDRVVCYATENTSQDLNNNSDIIEPLEVSASYSINEHVNAQESENYVVESPEQSLKPKSKRNKPKFDSVKSKSLDNDDAPQIVEITDNTAVSAENDCNVSVIDSSNVVVCEADTDVEWEKANELIPENTTDTKEVATGTLSITTIPLNVAQCEHTKSLTPEEEMSLRHYLQTLNLSTSPNVNSVEIKTEIEQIINREIKHRLRKKGLADDLFVQRLGPPRMLDVIDEEGSSESSMTSRRQSYLSDKKSDNDDLEDDVFEDKSKSIEKYVTKSIGHISNKSYGRLVPQQCMLVGTKLKEPGVTEARGDWTMQTVEKMTGAEVVYLTDSSSSTSSIHDIGDETDDSVETDVSVRMITPTIEVTDTEDLLKRTFVANSKDQIQSSNIEDTSQFNVIKNDEINHNRCDAEEDNPISKYCENPHEIVVLSTDDIKTNLYVKDLDEFELKVGNDENGKTCNKISLQGSKKEINNENDTNVYNLEMKVLKCELNDAINNLIKEVSSDSDVPNDNIKDTFTRQDSSSSVCSSQCTAKYNPTSSSLNDVSNIMHDETYQITDNSTKIVRNDNTTTHVKDVFECVTGTTANICSPHSIIDQPLTLRDLCVKKITNLPYGLKILEELASVSERLQNINVYGLTTKEKEKVTDKVNLKAESMPYYPLPDLSSIEKVSLPSKSQEPLAPPVQPRNSSLKKSQDDNHWTALPSKSDPVYVCFSPSQKMLMEKTNTVITKEDATELIDNHKKFVDRRGYNEYYSEKKIGHEHVKEPPVVPFKSQTGSRLLALIRDPTVTYNINSSMNDHYLKNQNYGNLDNSYKKSSNMNIKRDLSSTFKPIPPPRPKKYSSSFYESDESSDFTDSSFRSMKSERKYFHYSTGNLSKEIENDVSSIQNMHRHFTDIRDSFNETNLPRRPSLPKDICEKQMEYIRQKEKEVEAEIRRLEEEKSSMPGIPIRGPRAPLIKDNYNMDEQQHFDNDFGINSKNTSNNIQTPEKPARSRLKSLFSSSEEELLRDKMYSEYVNQMAERQERKQHRIIKITNTGGDSKAKTVSKSMSALDILDSKVNNRIEKEFISKARERWDKLGIKDPETEDERESSKDVYREPKVIEHKIKVIEGNRETDVKKLPSHLQDFVRFTAKDKDDGRSSSGEFGSKPASPHVVVWCAVVIIVLAIGRYFLRLLRNK